MREQRKLKAVRAVQCLDRPSDSVERLMTQHQTKIAKFSALSVQLRYHHVVLGSGSKLLNKTKLIPDQVTDNLILYSGIHCLLWNMKMLLRPAEQRGGGKGNGEAQGRCQDKRNQRGRKTTRKSKSKQDRVKMGKM